MSWSEMWLKYGQEKYNYDENFKNRFNSIFNNYLNKEKSR